jgi:1,2-diacylglycerol 3-alpha-glucosyltransferase
VIKLSSAAGTLPVHDHASYVLVNGSRPLRILFFSDVYFPRVNGVSTSIRTFRRELAALGHYTVLVAPEYPGAPARDDGVVRVPSLRVPFDPEDRGMRWGELNRHAERLGGGFDVVHVQTPFLAHYAGVGFARRHGLPCVTTYHTLFEEYLYHYVPLAPRAALRALARRYSRCQCDEVDTVVVPSTAMRDTLLAYGVSRTPAIVPTGIPLAEFATGDGARFRQELGIARGRPVLLFVGRVAHEKNIGFLLRMLVRVRRDVPDVLLLVCGEGPALGSLTSLADTLGLRDAVRFLGYLDRASALPDCYRAADAFVFASRTETQGLVLLEAMALGVPVVSTAVMGTADILAPRRGALVPDDDEADFAANVVRLLGDPALKARLAAEAAAYARTWSAPATARRLVAVYEEALDDPRRSAS